MAKKLILDAYTYRSDVFEFSKLRYTKDVIPQWWKDLPKEIQPNETIYPLPTMRTCYGFVQQFQHGFVVPLWSDLAIEFGGTGDPSATWNYSDRMSMANPHSPFERGEFMPLSNYFHLKLVNPWVLVCEDDVMWEAIKPMWNFDKPEEFMVPPGMFEFKYQHAANINMFFTRQEQSTRILLPHGQPMMQLIPLTERKLEIRQHLIPESEYRDIRGKHASISFVSKYLKAKAAKLRCPF